MQPIYEYWDSGCGCCSTSLRVQATGQRITLPNGQTVIEVQILKMDGGKFWLMEDDDLLREE